MTLAKDDIETAPKLGEGIFLTKDVATILRLPYSKVRHLMNSYWHAHSFGDEKNKAINFHALIEFYTFYKLREKGVAASEIKKAHTILGRDLGVKYPFALSGIKTDGKKLWYEQLGNIIKVDGKKQYDIKEFIDEFLQKIDFGKNNIAERFYPLTNSRKVVVDPKHQFGQPTVSGRNITTSAIRKLHEGGETIRNISTLYDLKQSQVVDALNFYKRTA
jgi:uncharacterized protein (DUF433 family)